MIARLIGFFKTPAGAAMLFLLAMFTFFYFVREHRERKALAATGTGKNVLGRMSPEESQPGESITSEWVKEGSYNKFTPPNETPPAPKPELRQAPPAKPGPLPKLVHLFQPPKAKEAAPEAIKPPRHFAPPGTLIPCQLVITVDSSSLNTPVVGFVTDDVWHNRQLVIPAGTEVHAFARTGRVRDRIEVSGEWKFVWRDGKEVRIHGIALDRDYDPEADSFALTDGSAGIRGTIHKSDELLEFKLFAATALSGISRNAKQTTRTVLGEYENNSWSNAALDGASSVSDRYAQLMLDQIEGDGLFVRVPAGSEFYVYTLQVFEPQLASVAGLKQGQRPSNSWQKSAVPESHDPALPANLRADRPPPVPDAIQTLQQREQLERFVRTYLQDHSIPATATP